MGEFAFDCEFCEATARATTAEELKDRGKTHLQAHHRDELNESFAERMAGEQCRNGCGYVFPVGMGEVAGFECPSCEYDHFTSFLDRYLYWRIESR